MNQRDLAYWIQGFNELSDVTIFELSDKQWNIIQNHVNLVINDDGGGLFLEGIKIALKFKDAESLFKYTSSFFEHVIDKLDKDPIKSQQIHDLHTYPGPGSANSMNGQKIRC